MSGTDSDDLSAPDEAKSRSMRTRRPRRGAREDRYRSWTGVPAASAVLIVVTVLTAHWPASAAFVLSVSALSSVGLQLVLTRRRAHDPVPWRWLGAGIGLVVFSTPTATAALTPLAGDGTVTSISAAAALLAYPLMFSGSLRLLHYRRQQVLPHVHAWFDGVGSVLGLAAILAAAPVPSLRSAGIDSVHAWTLLGRPMLLLVLAAFAVANCQLAGWRTDRRLVKVVAVFVLLLTGELLDLAAALGADTPQATSLAVGVRTCALVLGAAAAWRPAPRPAAVSDMTWAALSAPVSVFCLTMTAGYLHTQRAQTSLLTFWLIVAALGVVILKIVLIVRTLVDLLEVRRLSRMDDLTDLPNRRAFFEIVEDRTDWSDVVVMLLDLNGFKNVNDTLGHAFGDVLLQDSARRLEEAVPQSATVARLGGDEFVVFLHADAPTMVRVAEDIRQALGPRRVQGQDLQVSASIGIAAASGLVLATPAESITPRGGRRSHLSDEGRVRTEALLQAADAAMYQAKRSGGGWRLSTATVEGT